MAKSATKTVILPDGEEVEVYTKEHPCMQIHNNTLYVSPEELAPDLDQPRKFMNPTDIAELHESIESCGVVDTIIVTPLCHAPWAKVAPEHIDRKLLIVSGHRRTNGACIAGLSAVPVKVRIYNSEKDHILARSLFNSNRADISPLERGYEFVSLRRVGWKIKELCSRFGIESPKLYNRMNLTRLHSDIQARLDPSLPSKCRLSLGIGGALGSIETPTYDELEELYEKLAEAAGIDLDAIDEEIKDFDECGRRFELQKLFLVVIMKKSLSSVRAVALIKDHSLNLTVVTGTYNRGRPTQRFKPSRRKNIIKNLIGEITGSEVMEWTPVELRRIFELTSREGVEEFISMFQESASFLGGFVKILTKIRDEKKPTHPDALKAMNEKCPDGTHSRSLSSIVR